MGNARIIGKTDNTGFLPGAKTVVLAALVAVSTAQFIFPAPFLNGAVNYITVAAVLISLPFTGRTSGVICLALFFSGAYLIYASGAGWQQMMEALGKNTGLIVLLLAVPLLGVPLKHGGYIGVLDALALKCMRRRYQMYLVPAIFSHVLGVFMNLGAVPLTHEVTARGRLAGYPGLLAKSLSRGFGAALFWSPNMVVTALVLSYLNVPWQDYVHLGLLFAGIALLTGFVADLFSREGREPEEGRASGSAEPYIDRVKLGQLAAAGVVFLLIVILIETATGLPVIRTVPVIALALPAAWLFLLGRKDLIRAGYEDYFRNRINKYDGEVVLFAAAGFFSGALALSGWSERLCAYVMLFQAHSKAGMALVLLGAIILASLAGIHPMVLVSAFGASLDPAALGFTPVQMALVLIAGWALGAAVSPMSGTNLVVAGLTGKTPLEVGCANLPHAALVLAAIILYLAKG
ncbi:MAG: hypothetical protein K6T66_09140 [Peptococcaceae bacterium]|nr:hypothetical protein [Peptococcaceae bacterium]